MESSLELDAAVISGLRELDPDGAFLREVISVYLNLVPKHLDALQAAVAARDAAALRAEAHSLKSSSGNVGALQMRELSHRLEMMGRAGDLSEAVATLAELTAAFPRARQALEAEFLPSAA